MISILSKDSIMSNLQIIRDTIDNFQQLTDPAKTLDYLGDIVSLQATATETQASAKYWLLEATNEELNRQAKLAGNDKIAPSIKKLRADAMVRDWHYIYELAERLSRNISHTIDACRTKISYIKQELDNSKYSNAA